MIKKFTLFCLLLFLSSCQNKQNYLNLNGQKIFIEIADTDTKREQGLSNRQNLPKDAGMIFTFDKPGKYGFWMKDMKFSLDFIYIDNGYVTETKEDVLVDSYPQIFYPLHNSDAVLEINSGMVKEFNIKRGDKVILKAK